MAMATTQPVWLKDEISQRITLRWQIDNFSTMPNPHHSTIFTGENSSKSAWQLYIKHIGIKWYILPAVVSNQYSFQYMFRIIVNGKSRSLTTNTYHSESKNTQYFLLYESTPFIDFTNYLNGNSLNLRCIIDLLSNPVAISNPILNNKKIEKMDLRQLFQTGKCSDVILVASGKEIPAYKTVLSIRSDVFAAMFEHKSMQENKSNRIEITDFDHTVVEEMLHFMYSQESPNIDKMAPELLAIADKYALKNLRQLAELTMIRDVTADTVIKYLIWADRHGADELKAKCSEIVRANMSTIMFKEDWKSLHISYPNITMELLNLKESK